MQIQQPFGSQLIAGDTWDWTLNLQDYDPAVYTLKYFLRGPNTLDIVATASGTAFNAKTLSAATAVLSAGIYAWSMCVFDASNNRTELDRGQVEVLADIAGETAGLENRSWVKVSLDAVRAVLTGRASRVEKQYMINGREVQLLSPQELIALEGYLSSRYRREQVESGQLSPNSSQVQVSFGDASNPVLVRQWKNFPGNSA